jgi:spermidine synthase
MRQCLCASSRDTEHRGSPVTSERAAPIAPAPGAELVPGQFPSLVLVGVFAAAIFLNATLLFSVQPLFTKMVLPLLGGSPAVWNVCLLFFQTVLLAGYLYAHATSQFLRIREQAIVHLSLLLVALVVLPMQVPEGWMEPPSTGLATGWLLGLLTVSLGLPFFLLSAGAPLLQRWFAETRHERAQNPYFLYAASNLGSFVALLAYPFWVEPRMAISEQTVAWLELYYVALSLIGLSAVMAFFMRCGAAISKLEILADADVASIRSAEAIMNVPTAVPDSSLRIRWILLAFAPSSMLIGVTTYLSTDIAAVPFLWVIPLALYLLTFVIVFARRSLIERSLIHHAQLLLGLVLLVALCLRSTGGIVPTAVLHLLAFFATALMCHGELAASRPRADKLTEFYLWMSFGGMLGGVFNVLVAPMVFNSVVEYAMALVVAFSLRPAFTLTPVAARDRVMDLVLPGAVGGAILLAYHLPKTPDEWFARGPQLFLLAMMFVVFSFWKRPLRLALGALAMFAAVQVAGNTTGSVIWQDRSFFGVYRVRSLNGYHVLQHGTTLHGGQSLESSRRTEPLTYFYRGGPLGDVLANVPRSPAGRVAVVGLGAGAIACYARPDESWTFYEIDPLVADIARNPRLFTYLSDCAPKTAIVIGDARLKLREASDAGFDLLIVDAFSSDAIPAHLLTREAVASFMAKIRPSGALIIHISNQFLDLAPVIAAIADDAGLAGFVGERAPDVSGMAKLYSESRWVALARDPAVLSALGAVDGWNKLDAIPGARLWTDDYVDVLSAIKW